MLIEQNDPGIAQQLGAAVRMFPERLLVGVNSAHLDNTFFAFGFRRLGVMDEMDEQWFEYCLRDYKQPPEWLNARFWANPERFGTDADPDTHSEDPGVADDLLDDWEIESYDD
jgi:hypothetical protein